MAELEKRGFVPTNRQARFMDKISQRAATRIAAGETEFPVMGRLDQFKATYISQLAIQRAVYDACLEAGRETRTFLPGRYAGDVTSEVPDGLVLRVIGVDGMPGHAEVIEGQPVPGRPGFIALDVYPPQE